MAAIWGHAAPDRVATRNSGIGEPLAERISALTERRKEKCVGDRWKERRFGPQNLRGVASLTSSVAF